MVISLILLVIAIIQVMPNVLVDFPCQAGLGPRPEINEQTRLAYCISFWPLRASGGMVYDVGASGQDKTVIGRQDSFPGELTLERRGEVLLVSNQTLQAGEAYHEVRWAPSLNPMLVFTARFEVSNEGLAEDALYVSGDVYEGWLPNPMGLIMLGASAWLFLRERRKRKRAT